MEKIENEIKKNYKEYIEEIKNQVKADKEMAQFGTKVSGGFSMNQQQMLNYLKSCWRNPNGNFIIHRGE